MPSLINIPAKNRLLAALPEQDYEQVMANCELIHLKFAEVLYRVGDPISQIYFPVSGFISLVTPLDAGSSLEVGLIGEEGMLGITLTLGIDISPFQALVQGEGSALRIEAIVFTEILSNCDALKQLLNRYLYVFVSQLAQTAACCRIHVVEARLSRWLLMTQDRAHSDILHITHIFLAYMLGVRRVGITKAATSLQRQKLIHYRRGIITILDRTGLEAASCNCYRLEKRTYQTIMHK